MIYEISGDEMRPLMSRLKDRITNSTINVNPKCHKEYSVRNMSNFLCTTNNMNPLNIEPEERRFVVFGCNSSKKGDTAYFNELGKHLQRDDVARAFFCNYLAIASCRAHRVVIDVDHALGIGRSVGVFSKCETNQILNTAGISRTSLLGIIGLVNGVVANSDI